MPPEPRPVIQGLTLEFAVARVDGRLEFPRYGTREEADAFMADRYALKEQYRQECAAWEREAPDDDLHPSGTNEPWWRWHKQGWRDAEWYVVVREVSAWRSA